MLDWPLGPTALRSPAATVNLIGAPRGVGLTARLPAARQFPGAHVHLSAESARPGRGIGHVTALGAGPEEPLETARAAAGVLTQP